MAPKERNIDNVDNFCRLCAVEAKNELVIYSSEGMLLCLEDKILQCLRIRVSKDDILPKRVCCPCRSRLEDFYQFTEQANQVQFVLETMVKMKTFCNDSVEQKIDYNVEDKIDIKDETEDVSIAEIEVSDLNEHFDSNDKGRSVENLVQLKISRSVKESRIKRMNLRNSTKHQDIINLASKENSISNNSSECANTGVLISNHQNELKEDSYDCVKYVCNDPGLAGTEVNHLNEGHEYEFEKEEMEPKPQNMSVMSQVHYEMAQNSSDTSRDSPHQEEEEEEGDKNEYYTHLNEQNEWKTHWGIKCDQCEQVFPFRSQFDEHYQSSYDKQPVYTCSYCNKTMEKYSTFRSHCYRHVTEGRYRCQYCRKGFSLKSMRDAHILAKHTAEKPYICEECGKGFVTRSGLNTHLKKHKTNEKNEYPCPDCGKILHTSNGLKAHQNVHKLGRRFMCDICGKTFTQKVNMQQHVKRHTGERPYTCEKCGKGFAEKSHLNRHYSFHSEKRPFQCKVCLKMYKTQRCLAVHSMVHADARPYVCKYCSKGFLSSTKLKQHCNIHTGERPYACNYCERTFTNYSNWMKHTRRRHSVDPRKPLGSSREWIKLSDKKQEEHSHQQLLQANTLNTLLEEDPLGVHMNLSKTLSQLDGEYESAHPNSSKSSHSSSSMLHQFSEPPHSDIQSLSSQQIENLHSVVVQPTHQILQDQFSLNQVYSDHIIVTNETDNV